MANEQRAQAKKPPHLRPPPTIELARPPPGPHRSGFALLLGRPNVGKSTLLNALVGEHLAIVSPRPQTTRTRLLGIVNTPGTQLCLLDTPGVHRATDLLNRAMVQTALSAMSEVDVILYLAEAGWPSEAHRAPGEAIDPVGPYHRELLADVARSKKPVILVLTKVDLIPKPMLLPLMQAWSAAFPFREVYPLSALTGENMSEFVNVVRQFFPEGGPLFPPDSVTDQAERSLCAEFIREQVFLQTRDEIPYGVAVTIDDFDESERPLPEESDEEVAPLLAAEPEAVEQDEEDEEESADEEEPAKFEEPEERAPQRAKDRLGPGLVRIAASIIVPRDSHKGIVIGKGGDRLKQIGTASRHNIERLLGCRVWLEMHVRVIPGWTEKKSMLAELGYSGA